MKLTNLFTDYYSYEQRRNNSAYLLMNKYGHYPLLENDICLLDNLHFEELCGLRLIKIERGKIRLKNSFGKDICFRVSTVDNRDQFYMLIRNDYQKIEIFINDHTKKSAPIISHLITDEDLMSEINLMRLRAFSLS